MESENGVQVEDEKKGVVEMINEEGSVLDAKENDSVNKGEQVSIENVVSGTTMEAKQTLGPSVSEAELTNSNPKGTNSSKIASHSSSKINKTNKDQNNLKSSSLLARKTRPSLTQSLSFPARGPRADRVKSVDGCTIKSGTRHSQTNSSRSDIRLSNRTLSSVKGASKVGNSKGEITNTNGRRTTLASLPSQNSSLSAKATSSNGIGKQATSEELVNENPKPIKISMLAKVDEDARSTTSSSATPGGERKTSAAGFSFRLEERAEKRKEFFSKLEEKIHAREVEKCNLQAKSKESQEAEIKQLRKSLTFRATPMPSFYKEPPPKVELKKIPTTRAISPKLGRHKISDNSENGGSCLRPKVIEEQSKSPKNSLASGGKAGAASKKPFRRSQSKVLSRESLVTKTEPKPGKTESKPSKDEDGKDCVERAKEPVNSSELEEQMDTKSEKNSAEDNAPTLTPPKAAPEVTVEG